MTRIIIPLAALLCSFVPSASAQSLEQEIRSEVLRFVERVNRGDAALWADTYLARPTADAGGIGLTTIRQQGLSDVLSLMYASPGLMWMTVDSVTVTPLGRDAAIAHFRYVWDYRTDPGATATGAMTLAFVRSGAGWKVAHDHTSTLQAAATATPSYEGPTNPVRPTFLCTVTRVIDGDTIECEEVGRVRLIGMDTPESDQRPYGSQATQALIDLISGSGETRLELDVERRDQYERVLAYVRADGRMLNWILVRSGYAIVLTYPPNVQYVDWFTAAQQTAQQESTGLWATDGFACRPIDHRRGRCD